jgi:hypothetical protein
MASISGRVRKCTCRLSWRLLGMASMRWIRALCAGSSNDTNRKKERTAVRRRLRVLALAPRFASRSVRNAPMSGASRSSSARADGGLRSRACANVNSSRNVSLYDAIVLALTLRWRMSRSVK